MFVSRRRFHRILEYLGITDYPALGRSDIYSHEEGVFQRIKKDHDDDIYRLESQFESIRGDLAALLDHQGLVINNGRQVLTIKEPKKGNK